MIPSPKYLKSKAARRLEAAQQQQQILLIYALIALSTSFAVTAVRYALGNQIAQTGGLHNLGLRSILSTADSVLPILQTALLMCLNLGFLAAMLRIARHQYTSPKSMLTGLQRFWVLLRSRILKTFIFFGIYILSFYFAVSLFLLSPLSETFMQYVEPMAASSNYDPQILLENAEFMRSIIPSMLPMLALFVLAIAALGIPVFYRFRLVDYLIVDFPAYGASYAMRQSRVPMRGNAFSLFKLDLSFWWYYLLEFLITGIIYLDLILAIVGIELPVSEATLFFGSFLLYLAAEFSIFYFFKNKVAVSYALAYDSLIPKPEKDTGVVLGNIFQM